MSYYELKNNVSSLQHLKSKYDPDNTGLMLDLGCGYYKPLGYIGVDNLIGHNSQVENQENFPDILMDINNEKIPFEDNSCIRIRASHFIEHSNLDHVFAEVWRLLKPYGVFNFIVPYANSSEGMYPGHSIFLTEKFFYENLHFQKLFRINKEIFKESSDYTNLPKKIKKIFPFEIARKHLFNACSEMEIIAAPKK